jgi:hypothetical protein
MACFKKAARPDVLALAALLFCALAYFRHGLLLDTVTLHWDAADSHHPLLDYGTRLWRNGTVPLWNPFLFNGYPHAADPQSQTFYPPSLMIGLLFDFTPKAVYAQFVLHCVLAAMFAYLLAGRYLHSVPARLLVGLCVLYNGFVLDHFQHVAIVATAAWLPLILLCVEKTVLERSASSIALGAGAVAMAILAGHPQTYTYLLWTALLWALVVALRGGWQGARPALHAAIGIALLFTAGLALAAIQLLPTYELVQASNRAWSLPYWFAASSGQISPAELATMLLPDYHGSIRGPFVSGGDISHGSVYFGALPLFLAVLVLTTKPRRPVLELLAMALFGLLFSMGHHGWIYQSLFELVPGIGRFRSPAHFGFVFMLFAALLAGHGLEALIRKELRFRPALFVLAGVLLAAAGLLLFVQPPDPRVAANVRQGLYILAAALAVCLVSLGLSRRDRVSAGTLGLGLLTAAFVEILLSTSGAITLGARARHEALEEQEAPLLRSLAGDLDSDSLVLGPEQLDRQLYRVYVNADVYSADNPVPNGAAFGVVGMNRAILYKLFLTDGYNPLVPKRHIDFALFMRGKIPWPMFGLRRVEPGQQVEAMERLLGLCNVKIVLTRQDDGQDLLHQLNGFVPRLYFAGRARWAKNGRGALKLLEDPSFAPGREVVLEGPRSASVQPEASVPAAAVRLIRYEPNEVVVQVETPAPGYVVFVDSFYPGWQAEIDAQPVQVLRANYLFKAVAVKAGRHEVVFRFRPRSVLLGSVISSTTLLLGAAMLGWLRLQRTRRQALRAGHR